MTILSTPHIIALSLLDGVGNKTIQNIVEVLKARQLTIETPYELCDFLSIAKADKLVPRLKEYTPDEVTEKTTLAEVQGIMANQTEEEPAEGAAE